MPGMEVPYTIGLVELVEQADLRLTTNLVGCAPDAVEIGMPVRVTFREVSDEIALPLFEPDLEASRPAPPPRVAHPIAPDIHPGSDQHLERRAILSGVGQSQIGRRLLRTDLDLTCEAALAAIADAGLTTGDIDGLACYPGPMGAAAPGFAGPGTPDVQDALGLQLGWHGSGGEGPAQLAPVMLAALAVAAGLCRHALVYRTVTEATAAASTGRLGIGAGSRSVSGFAQWVIPFGAMSAANWLALHAVRHMHEYGTRREHLGEIALTARAQVLAPGAVLVHVAHGVERQPVGRRHGAEGDHPLREARHAARAGADAEPPRAGRGRRLGHRAVDERVAAEARRHRERGEHHGGELRRPLATRAVPAELEAEGVLHVGRARSREARRGGAHRSRVAGEAVDVPGSQARVGDRGQRRLAGEVQIGAKEAPPDLRLPDAGEDRAPLEVLVGPGVDGGRDRVRDARRRGGAARLAIRLEERERDLVAHIAERHPHWHADLDRVGCAADEVGRQPEIGL